MEKTMNNLSKIKNALEEIGCEMYFQNLVDEETDWDAFLSFNREILNKEMNIPLGTFFFLFQFLPLFLIFGHVRFSSRFGKNMLQESQNTSKSRNQFHFLPQSHHRLAKKFLGKETIHLFHSILQNK